MLRLTRPQHAHQRENTIALINIVFLMLIFFLVAGTMTPPLDGEVDLITTAHAERAEAPGVLFATAGGELRAGGEPVDPVLFVADRRAKTDPAQELEINMIADRDLPAARLVEIVGALKAAGADRICIITERVTQ